MCPKTNLRSLAIGILAPLLLFAFPSIASGGRDDATFELTISVIWSAQSHPYQFPANAHMSSLTGVTHHSRYTLFRDGDTASSGLELVAENGRTKILKAELAEALRRRRVSSVFDGDPLAIVPGEIKVTFRAQKSHPLLSFVTMIAPSPDWFTGAAAVSLRQGERWIERKEITLWAWDSGTDNGKSYSTANLDTQPRQSVRLLATRHVLGRDGLIPIGKAVIRRVLQ